MSLKKLSFDEALELESESLITIYDFHPDATELQHHPRAREWYRNYSDIRFKFRQHSPSEVSTMLNCDYRIEIPLPYEPETNTHTWKFLYAKLTEDLVKFKQYHSRGSFVYVLTNPAYPDFVKIGKAVNPLRRVEQINGPGVVSEWSLRYSLPVESDFMIEHSVHEYLVNHRQSTDQGSSREFFNVTLDRAIEVIEMMGERTKTGTGIYY